MHFVSKSMVMVLAATLAACGLYEDVPVFSGDVLEEGDSCGPCDLGVYGASSCDLGELDGAVDPSAACAAVIFVDAERGSDEAEAGTQDKPFETLKAAIRAGNERNASVVVVAGDDVHQGPIQLGDGLSVVGGFARDWTENIENQPVIRADSSEDTQQSWAVLASGVRRPTVVRNVRIESQGSATTHYGIRVVDSQGLVLERVRVRAAKGRDGQDGSPGSQGEDGERGKNAGTPGRRDEGDAGENDICPEAHGGTGGRGALETEDGSQSAEQGGNSAAGVAGGEVGSDGAHGADGEPGEDGAPGAQGAVDGGVWVLGGPGSIGAAGEPGEGGGGGGGGAVMGSDGIGGGGGGGGAGGCGGEGGVGGEPGGASFGMLIVDSELVILASEIESSDGGNGGAGGRGGVGGEGGQAGFGMDGEGAGRDGGDGGEGGSGGDGGRGGPGRGGVSYGVFCVGESSVSVENSELRSGDGGLMGGGSEERASSSASQGCGL